jgi:uncharacterized protein (TIGR03435 family)
VSCNALQWIGKASGSSGDLIGEHVSPLFAIETPDSSRIGQKLQTSRSFGYTSPLITKQRQIAELLGAHFDRHLVGHTGLTAAYTFSLPVVQGGDNDPNAHSPTEEDLSTAEGLAELGLSLEPAKEPVERLSIDHIERPPVDAVEAARENLVIGQA